MTPQEQQLLQGLTDRVNQTQLTDKDPDAEQFIFQNLGKNSDSLYILAQTVLVQEYALDSAKKQLADLKQQLDQAQLDLDHARQQVQQQPVKHTSFLGSLLGTDDRPAPPPPPPAYQPVPTYAPPPPQYAQPVGYGAPMGYGAPQGGGFLRSAMTTATGVAAGALAFEGIESLMHGFGQHAGYGSGFDGGMGGGRPEEIINNNYYGDATPGSEHHSGDLTDRFQAAGDQPSDDIEDRRDAFTDTSNNVQADDSTNDDNFVDNSTSDDSGGFDDSGSDSGGFDSGGSDDSSF
jgi:hypothetical protein